MCVIRSEEESYGVTLSDGRDGEYVMKWHNIRLVTTGLVSSGSLYLRAQSTGC
jgi:hypothetical protein